MTRSQAYRRRFLQSSLAATLAAVAGCSGGDDGNDAEGEDGEDDTDAPTAGEAGGENTDGTMSGGETTTVRPTTTLAPTTTAPPTASDPGHAATVDGAVTAGDGDGDDLFGQAVAVDGDTAVVGAPGDEDPNGNGAGTAYVFERSGDGWTEAAKLVPDDGASMDGFGSAVAAADGAVLVGAPGTDTDAGQGAGTVYAFEPSGDGWTQTTAIRPGDGGAEAGFGTAVAVADGVAVVGAPRATANGRTGAGAAYVVERTSSGWTAPERLVASDGSALSYFGRSVAVAGDLVVVGALAESDPNGEDAGAAYAFERSGDGWTGAAKLLASDGDEGDYFGQSVAADADRVLVGAMFDEDPNGDRAGSAYLFDRGDWAAPTKLVADDGGESDYFGWSAALDGGTAVVGAPQREGPNGSVDGAAYVFEP